MIWQTPSELFIASLPICVLDFSSSCNWPSELDQLSGWTEDKVEKGGVWDVLFWQQQPNLK